MRLVPPPLLSISFGALLIAAFSATTVHASNRNSANLTELGRLYQRGEYHQAYQLAQSRRRFSEGNPDFDYLFALISLKNGRAGEAVFALERVLMVRPNDADARLALGKGYQLLGQQLLALHAYQRIVDTAPGTTAAKEANRLLELLQETTSNEMTRVQAYLQAGFGHDSNVNSSTDDRFFTSPVLGNRRIRDRDLPRNANKLRFGIGARISHDLTDSTGIFGGVAVEKNHHVNDTRFALTNENFELGAYHAHDDHLFRLIGQLQDVSVDGAAYREQQALSLDWNYALSPNQTLHAFTQVGRILYDNRADADTETFSFGVGTRLITPWYLLPSVNGMIFYGDDDSAGYTVENHSQSDRKSLGIKIEGKIKVDERSDLDVAVTWQHVKHETTDTLFLVKREDDFVNFGVSYTYKIKKDVKAILEFSRSDQNSNIDIHDFSRNQAMVSIRYDLQ